MEKQFLKDEDINNSIDVLVSKITASGFRPKRIVALARGGLIPGVHLSYRMGDIPLFPIMVSSYDGERSGEVKVRTEYELYDGDLIVDDVYDTGKTIAHILAVDKRAYMKNGRAADDRHIATAVMFTKSQEGCADFYGRIVDSDTWIVFPWGG